MKVWLPLYSLGSWVTIEREWLSQPEWSRAREEGGGWRAWSVGPLRLVSTSIACSSSITGSYSPRQGMVHQSDVVRVVVVHLLSCRMWVHSAHRGLRPCARYPGGSVVAPAHEQGGLPRHGGVVLDHTRLGRGSSGLAGSKEIDSWS